MKDNLDWVHHDSKTFDDKWLEKPSKKELYDLVEEQSKEIERLKTNLEVANEDLTKIAQLLNLEEGCTIYDIENKIKRLNKKNEQLRTALNSKESIIKEVREYVSTIIVEETYTKCILEILDKVGSEDNE